MEERDARLGRAGIHAYLNDFTSSDPETAFRAIVRRFLSRIIVRLQRKCVRSQESTYRVINRG